MIILYLSDAYITYNSLNKDKIIWIFYYTFTLINGLGKNSVQTDKDNTLHHPKERTFNSSWWFVITTKTKYIANYF